MVFKIAIGFVSALLLLTHHACAENVEDFLDFDGHSGLAPASEEEYASFTKAPHFRAFLPVAVDLSTAFPPPGGQKAGSCTSWAVAYAARSYYHGASGHSLRNPSNLASPAFLYHALNTARLENSPKSKCDGSSIADAMRVLQRGISSVAHYHYLDSQCRPLSKDERDQGTDFSIADWNALDTGRSSLIEDVRGQIARGNPVVIGVNFYFLHARTAFWQYDANHPFFKKEDDHQWGHAVTLVGYDDRTRQFKFINSWTVRWGLGGFGFIAYDSLQIRDFVGEAYTMTPTQDDVPSRPKPVPSPPPLPAPAPSPGPVPDPRPPVDLDQLQCGEVTIQKHGSSTSVEGFVSTQDDENAVATNAAQNGWANKTRIVLWPQCEAVLTLGKHLDAASGPTISLPKKTWTSGESMHFNVTNGEGISYVYVAYLQADGTVVPVYQPSGPVPEPTLPRATLDFGTGRTGRPELTVSAPFGTESIIAITSKSPLFDGALPEHQTEREFLTALRKAIIYKPDPNMPDRDVSAALVTLDTGERR